MKNLVIVIIITISTLNFSYAQNGWEKEMEIMQTELADELSNIHANHIKDLAINNIRLSIDAGNSTEESVKDTHSVTEIKEIKQNQSNLFNKLADIKGIEMVYISKSLLGMMPDMELSSSNVDISSIAGKLEELQIFSTEQKNAINTLRKEANELIKKGKYETIMFVKDDESKTAFYFKKHDKSKSEMLMVSEEEDEMILIRFTGNFSVKDIQEITNINN